MRRLLILLSLFSGCSVDPGASSAIRCSDTEPCAADGRCYRGFCVPAPTFPDATVMDSRDAAPTPDAAGADAGPIECDGAATRPCYSANDPLTLGRGECRGGIEVCVEGRWSAACFGEQVPSAEIACNGRDDNCDERIDEIAGPQSCDTGLLGACAAGRVMCAPGGGIDCVQTSTPAIEVCNGDDDDCNGTADDNETPCFPEMIDGCVEEGEGSFRCVGACRLGRQSCQERDDGVCRDAITPEPMDGCTAVTATVAIDDDCDGEIDEDCPCTLGEQVPCYGGAPATAGVGPCRAGVAVCETSTSGSNRFGACTNERRPGPETCANEGVDDDCDNRRDDVPDRGLQCPTGSNGICATGTQQCMGNNLACVAPPAQTEVCNGLDDDCDGTTDEGFDFTTNPNCGRCGNSCSAGLSCCNGECVDLSTTPAYCGGCTTSCGAGLACCNRACTNTQTDEQSCGVCGATCSAGQECCAGRCVDRSSDRNNCGQCGRACMAGQQCCGGVCAMPNAPACTGCAMTCMMGETCCAPIAAVCSNPMTDEQRCGGCGSPACAAGQLCCGGACQNRDETSCSECGVGCMAGSLCCGGACTPRNTTNCLSCGDSCSANEQCCMTGCADLTHDENNCGMCGRTCASGVCCNGACVADPLTNAETCGPQCLDCTFLFGLFGRCIDGRCGP